MDNLFLPILQRRRILTNINTTPVAELPWWLIDGIDPSECLFAYRPIAYVCGEELESRNNDAAPLNGLPDGTYDGIQTGNVEVVPTAGWAAATGSWIDSTLVLTERPSNYSVVCRYVANPGITEEDWEIFKDEFTFRPFGTYKLTVTTARFYMSMFPDGAYSQNRVFVEAGYKTITSDGLAYTGGTIGIADRYGYVNGIKCSDQTTAGATIPPGNIFVCGVSKQDNTLYTATYPEICLCMIALYKKILSDEQMLSLHDKFMVYTS